MARLFCVSAHSRGRASRVRDRERRLVGGNRLLQVVGAIAADAVLIGVAQAKPQLAFDVLSCSLQRPLLERGLQGQHLLAKRDPFLGVLSLLPALIEPDEFCGFFLLLLLCLILLRPDRKNRRHDDKDADAETRQQAAHEPLPIAALQRGRKQRMS